MGDEKAQRVRNLLSSYYGLAEGAEEGPAKSGPVSELDQPVFDAPRYMSGLLRKLPLPELMDRHVTLSKEIKTLDSQMQTLVYENYNKFITATDTIRDMMSDVDGMGSSMESLSGQMDKVSVQSEAVNARLQERRRKIDEMNSLRSLLQKLQVVFDLPARIQAAMDNDAVEVAVDYYVKAAPFLRQNGDREPFRGIREKADGHRARMCDALKARMVTDKHEAAECIQMLQRMGEPVEDLQGDFLESKRAILDSIADTGQGAPGEPEGGPDALARGEALHGRYCHEVAQTIQAYLELFPQGEGMLAAGVREHFAGYLGVLKPLLLAAAGPATPPDALVAALKKFSADVEAVDDRLPALALGDRAAEVLEAVVRRYVTASFGALAEFFPQRLAKAAALFQPPDEAAGGGSPSSSSAASALVSPKSRHTLKGQPLLRAFHEATEGFAEEFGATLSNVRDVYRTGSFLVAGWSETYVALVCAQCEELFLATLAHLEGVARGDGAGGGGLPPAAVLLASRLAAHVAATALAVCGDVLLKAFGSHPALDAAPLSVLAADFERLGARILKAYVDSQGRRLSTLVQAGMRAEASGGGEGAAGGGGADPAGARDVFYAVLDELDDLEADVCQLIDDGGQRAVARRPQEADLVPSAAGNMALQRNVDRLFREKLKIFRDVIEATQIAILGGVTKILLKSFLEAIRLETLSAAGFKQLQVDIAFLRPKLRRFSDDDAAIDYLMDEALTAATERSLEPPELLDSATVRRILDSGLGGY